METAAHEKQDCETEMTSGVHVPDFATWRVESLSRSNSYWGMLVCELLSGIWAASSGCAEPSMIASELSRQPKVSRIGPDSRGVADFSGGMFDAGCLDELFCKDRT
jgi:hypothetical protein